jgi:hypothetical protein
MHELQAPAPGILAGTGVIRDPQGNIKGTFSFGGPATPEQVKAVFGVDVANLPAKTDEET